MRQNKKISNTIYMLIAATLLLSTPLHSQVFHTQEDLNSEVRDQWKDLGLVVPIPVEEEGTEEEDSKYVSVGSGLAMLAALGGAYLMSKKRKKDA
jgi:hypothetical protein